MSVPVCRNLRLRICDLQPERISGEPYTVKSDVWSLGITLIEIAIGRFPFSSDDDASSSDDDADAALARLSLNVDEANDEMRDSFGDDLDDTLSPARPEKKRESILLAEERRASKRDSARPSRAIQRQKPRKAARGVSLAGSGHQMSILELLQHIVNEPAPHLPPGRFSSAAEEFVNATLRKEPIGWNFKKKGPLPQALARPTPKELLVCAACAGSVVEPAADGLPRCLHTGIRVDSQGGCR